MNRIVLMEKVVNTTLGNDGFIYFDKPIENKLYGSSKKINRIKNGSFYYKDEVLPLQWIDLKEKTLLMLFNEFKDKRIHTFYEHNGKCLKLRLKRNSRFI